MQVAILTPTYNRAHTLPRLYDSLLAQTDKNFVWYVIDDGSTDDTKKLIERYRKEKRVKIKYYYKKNGGKHRALNFGAEKIYEELIFMVDSDDWLRPNAIEKILKIYSKYKNRDDIAVFSFHKEYSNGQLSGPHYKQKIFIDNHIDYRINHHIKGENAEVVKAKCFKEFPFPEIKGEKFLSEGYLWINLAKKYNTVYVDEPIYVFDYLDDGLTKNLNKLRFCNPKGVVLEQKMCFDKRFAIIPRIKATLRYAAYGKIANYSVKKLLKETDNKLLFMLFYVPSLLYYLRCKEYKG